MSVANAANWDAGRVDALFDALAEAPPAPVAVTPYHEAAATLASFDPLTLQAVGREGAATGDERRRLLADSARLDADGAAPPRYSLTVEARTAALQAIDTPERLLAARAANPVPPAYPMQRLIDAMLSPAPPSAEALADDDVAPALQVIDWLAALPFAHTLRLPDRTVLNRRLAWQRLVLPLRRAVGRHFRGRSAELRAIRRHDTTPHVDGPLTLWGVGGVGKSTLLARGLLGHIGVRANRLTPPFSNAPFAYLDCDGDAFSPQRPATMLLAIVRQLIAQAPRPVPKLELLQLKITDATPPVVEKGSHPAQAALSVAAFSGSGGFEWLYTLGEALDDVPEWNGRSLLIAIDTFERVQYHSREVVEAVRAFVGQLADAIGRARVLIAGRAPVEFGKMRQIKGLGRAAAVACLRQLGVSEAAAPLVQRAVGGNPLALHLAATVARDKPAGEVIDYFTGDAFAGRVRAELVQGYLYRRILGRIGNAKVRKLAHPGLVLRRITPDLIQNVLAGPCGVDVPDAAAAQDLWRLLARETSLVLTDQTSALRHRPELRHEMLALLNASAPDQVRAVHLAAMDYYAARTDSPSRAEELYHRLCLDEPPAGLDARWQDAALPSLRESADDLPPRAAAYLASRAGGGLEAINVTRDDWAATDLGVWERKTAAWVLDMIAQDRPEDALRAMAERTERSPASPLFRLEARVRERLGEYKEARAVLERGIAGWPDGVDRMDRGDLYVTLAGVCRALHDFSAGSLALIRAGVDYGKDASLDRKVALLVEEIELTENEQIAGMSRRALAGVLDVATLPELATIGPVGRRAAAELLTTDAALAAKVIRAVGLGAVDVERLSELARQHKLPVGPVQQMAERLADLLTGPIAASPSVLEFLADQLRGRPMDRQREQAARTLNAANNRTNRIGQLAELIAKALDYSDLTVLATTRLSVRLESLVSPNQTLVAQVFELVRWAEQNGRTNELIDALVAERSHLRDSLRRLGYLTSAGDSPPAAVDTKLRLRESQEFELVQALLSTFDQTGATLGEVLRQRLGRDLPELAESNKASPQSPKIGLLVAATKANRDGWIGELITAARDARPDSAQLYAVAQSIGLTALSASADRRLRDGRAVDDISLFRSRLGVAETRVALIDVGSAYATGMLVGPDRLLTAYHGVADVIEGRKRPSGVSVRFDYRRLQDGTETHKGTFFRLSDADWLIAADPPSDQGGLDFCLLRLETDAGERPIGWPRAEAFADARGWFDLDRPADLGRPQGALLLSYSGPGPLRCEVAADHRCADTGDGHVDYGLLGEPGSSGGVVLDLDLRPIAMHQRSTHARSRQKGTGFGQGLLLSAVARRLAELKSGSAGRIEDASPKGIVMSENRVVTFAEMSRVLTERKAFESTAASKLVGASESPPPMDEPTIDFTPGQPPPDEQTLQAARKLIEGALAEIEREDAGNDLLATTSDEVGSLLQSYFAYRSAGFEEKFDSKDILGWIGSFFDWWRKIRPHPWIVAPEGITDLGDTDLRIGMLADWGTGLYGAPECAKQLSEDPAGFDLLIHLGDVYYSGTKKEIAERFLPLWPKQARLAHLALNSNHEMYGGGWGYFDLTLKTFAERSTAFKQSASYFAIANRHFTLVGLDTGYKDDDLAGDQAAWLARIVVQSEATGRRVILMSHHQPFSAFDGNGDKTVEKLEELKLLSGKRIFAWYFGHEHRLVIYDQHPDWALHARCLGHGGMPYFRDKLDGVTPETTALYRVEGRTKKGIVTPPARVLDGPNPYVGKHRLKYGPNGYVVLELKGKQVVESYRLPDGKELLSTTIG